MPKVKPIDGILDIETYAHQSKVSFRIVDADLAQPVEQSEPVEVPVSIVYRLFHLGRAYDFQAIKQLTTGMARIEYLDLPRLHLEFERIFEIVNDPVARHYLQLLLQLIASNRHNTRTALLIRPQQTGDPR